MKKDFIQTLKQQILIADGAMGTMLYEKGIFINSCFDELNLTRPEWILEIHKQYIEAGADIIETNTFGANKMRLSKFGLADKVELINHKGVELAREAGEDVFVAGAIGPIGVEVQLKNQSERNNIMEAFAEQIKALDDAGADLLLFETFTNVAELLLGLEAAKGITSLPIVAQITVNEDGRNIYGVKVEDAICELNKVDNIVAVGLNCSVGPAAILNNLKQIRPLTDKAISIIPNAGMPRNIDGRNIYMCTPEYMAEYAKRFQENGANIIGGCCGTTPEHIREMASAVKAIVKSQIRPMFVAKKMQDIKAMPQEPTALVEKSRLGKKLATGKKVYCVELVPPKGVDIKSTIEKVKLCADYGIDAINIPDGPRASSRLSPLVTAIKVEEAANIETILHVCCRDRNLIGMQSDLLGAYAMGLRNMLFITGDPPKLGEYPDATAVFDLDSIGLTDVASNLNKGIDVGGNEISPKLEMVIGVGANPVASDLEREIERFRAKVAAGAEYAITQPVFDVKMFLSFIKSVKDCNVPFIAGIWPFTSYKNAEFMANEVPGVVVPDKLLTRMAKTKTKEEGRREGILIAQEMIAELNDYAAGFAISAPFGNARIALAVLGKIAIDKV